jgi:FAD:protein FMN transferase
MNTEINAAFWCLEQEIHELELRARDWFARVERRFSRFDPDSELSALNRLAGERCLISNAMLEVLMLSEEFRHSTDGIFNPLVLNALLAAGYRTSFEQLPFVTTVRSTPEAAVNAMRIDTRMKSVQLPEGAQLDLGGIVKSWAVKRLAQGLQQHKELLRGMINAGGDLIVWDHRRGEAGGWEIDITHPWRNEEILDTLIIANSSAATSGVMRRQWHTDQGVKHHLIDTRLMDSSKSDVAQCTVYGPDITMCEVWAKVICILGCQVGLDIFLRKSPGYEALVFTRNEEMVLSSHSDMLRERG